MQGRIFPPSEIFYTTPTPLRAHRTSNQKKLVHKQELNRVKT